MRSERAPGRVLIPLLLALCAVASAVSLDHLRFEHRAESLLREDEAGEAERLALERDFGSDDILLIAWPVASVTDPEEFETLVGITRALERIDGIEECYSLASEGVPLPLDRLRPLAREDLATPESRARVADALRGSPVYRGTLYDSSLTAVAVATTLAPAPREAKEECVRRIRESVRGYEREGRPIYLAGVTPLTMDASRYALSDLRTIGVLALCVSIVVLLALTGSVRETLAAVVATGLPPLYALGLAAGLQIPITALGAALFPVLAVVGLTSSIHLLHAYGEARRGGAGPAAAGRSARRSVAAPTLLSLATTAVAFFSLAQTGVPAFRDGGLVVGLGLLAAMPVVLFGLPALLALVRPRVRRPAVLRLDRPLLAMARFTARRPRSVLLGSLILLAMGLFGLTAARTSSSVFLAFKEGSRIAQTYEFLDSRLTALLPADVVLRPRADAGDAEIVADLEEFGRQVSAIEGVDSAMSMATFASWGASILGLPDGATRDPASLRAVLQVLRGQFGKISRRFESAPRDGVRHYRVKVRVRETAGTTALDELEAAVNGFRSGDATLTGLYPRAVATARSVVPDLIAGAGAMLLFVAVTAAVALRSMRAGLATLFPNLLPVVVVFGFASLVGIELGVATMAVASVAIGLAVDDTLHLLFAAARARRAGRTRRGSLWRAQRSVGRAVVMSTAVLVGGLGCLALSVFVPTAEFGLYAAASSLIALVGDLLLLPAVVLRLRAL